MGSARQSARKVSRECLAYRCRRLSRWVTRIYDDALRSHGLTAAQFSLLGAIQLAAPVKAAELGRILGIEKSTLSRNLRLMSEAGWIEPSGEVRRCLVPTHDGQTVFLAAMPAWKKAQSRVEQNLGEDAVAVLDSLLDRRVE